MRVFFVILVTLLPMHPFCQSTELSDDQGKIEKPNILFIFLDDFGWRDCGFMGSDFYETPHLDQLAGEGMIFTNAYSASANCAPARASLLSGQYSPRHQIYNVGTSRRGEPQFGKLMHVPGTDTLDRGIKTWAKQIQQNGYRTAIMGKWHLSQDPRPYGFHINIAGSHSGSPPRGYFPPHPNVPGLDSAAKDEYLTDRLTQEAVTFIEENSSRPWLLYLSHFAVHTPLQGRPDLVEKYNHKPKGSLHDHAVMAAMIESVDQGIGKLIETLDRTQQRNNTVVIFSSDNGGYGPATSMHPLKGYKGTYYEGGIREPLFFTWPGIIKSGTSNSSPVINIDLYPTLCEITGSPMPSDQVLDGVSLMPLLRGEKHQLSDRALYWHFPAYLQSYQRIDEQRDPLFRSRPCSIIRYGQWKLHEYFEDGALELYDLSKDVGETTNLSQTNPRKAEELHQILIRWRASINAPIPATPNPHFSAQAEAEAMAKIKSKKKKRVKSSK